MPIIHCIVNNKYVCISLHVYSIHLYDEEKTLDKYTRPSHLGLYYFPNMNKDGSGSTCGLQFYKLENSQWEYFQLLIDENFKFYTQEGTKPYQASLLTEIRPSIILNPHDYIDFEVHGDIRCCTVCGENSSCGRMCRGEIYRVQNACDPGNPKRNCKLTVIKRDGYEIQYNKYIVLQVMEYGQVNVIKVREECDITTVLEHNNILYVALEDVLFAEKIPLVDYKSRMELIKAAECVSNATQQVSILNDEYWLRELVSYV